jgi:DNA adenine methylase
MDTNKKTETEVSNKVKPFLKWAGGKRSLLPELLKFIPQKYNRYFEPFLGSGALFFALSSKKAYLSDLNRELVNAYKQVKNKARLVNAKLSKLRFSKATYLRLKKNKSGDCLSRAVRFMYLNKTCWNGLYRENKKGEFNVPIGKYKAPLICDKENLEKVNKVLKNAIISRNDFEVILRKARKGDLIYLDPPYVTGHSNNGFIEYNSKIFSWHDQKRLRKVVGVLHKKGCKIIMSNASHVVIRNLYKGFKLHSVKRHSHIAGIVKNRKRITELIITNF